MAQSITSSWILPAAIIVLLLVFHSCSGTSVTTDVRQAVRLQSDDDKPKPAPVAAPKASAKVSGRESRRITENKVLAAYLDNNSSGFARLGKRVTPSGKPKYYPQIQHYFRSNENSFETIIQKKTKKKKDPNLPGIPKAIQESETVDDPES
jgi:hypothetical protein